MAEIKEGILGGFQGKVGTVVGFPWRNKNLMRSMPKKTFKPRSEKQLIQQSKLTYCTQFLTPLRKFINKNIAVSNKNQIGFDLLLSKLMKEMYIENDEIFHIDYSHLYLALGVLPTTLKTNVKFLKNRKLKLQWEDNSCQGLAEKEDKLSVIALMQEMQKFHVFKRIANREDGKISLILPDKWIKGSIHLWYIWSNEADNLNSTSMYLGCLEIPVKEEE